MGDLPRRASSGRGRAPTPTLLIKGNEVPLRGGATVIGRGSECRVSIAGGLISRQHARLTNSAGQVTVEDLGSRNGVFVNGRRIEQPTPLSDGDTLLIGTTEIAFFFGPPGLDDPPSKRLCFDEQGNVLSQVDEDVGALATQVHFEPVEPEPQEFDREDITVQGSRPPPPRLSGLVAREPVPIPTEPSMAATREPVPAPALPPLELELDYNPPTPVSGAIRRSSPGVGAPPAGTQPSARLPLARVTSATPPAPKDPFMAVVDVVTRMLARNDEDAAVRTLSAQLDRRLALLRSGQPLDARTLDAAGVCCLDVCRAVGDPAWFDKAVELFATARRPMGSVVMDRINDLASALPPTSRARFLEYQELVRALLAEVEIADLENCERVLATKL